MSLENKVKLKTFSPTDLKFKTKQWMESKFSILDKLEFGGKWRLC